MSNIIDNICKLRDLLVSKDYRKIVFNHRLIDSIYKEINLNTIRKSKDYSYELDFTSQDLRELAKDIRDTFKRWENELSPEKNIKKYIDKVQDGKLDIQPMNDKICEYLEYRALNIMPLIKLLGLCEGQGAILYFLELASNDKFAITCTERLGKY